MKLLLSKLSCPSFTSRSSTTSAYHLHPSDRQKLAPQLFLGAYAGLPTSESLIGYVCATRSSANTLTHESMSRHEADGRSVCIHSVCVDSSYRRRGVASKLLEEYSKRLSEDLTIHQLLLIAHDDLIQLYEGAGFEFRGKSPVEHGSRAWFELRRILHPDHSSVSPAILEALSKSSTPMAKIEFSQIDSETLQSGNSYNQLDLLCPRPNCGSVILKKGVGRFHLKLAAVDVR
jgi:guanine nucleotide exchange factor